MVLCRDLRGSFVDGNCRDVKNKRGNIGYGLVRFVVCVRRIWHYNFGENLVFPMSVASVYFDEKRENVIG